MRCEEERKVWGVVEVKGWKIYDILNTRMYIIMAIHTYNIAGLPAFVNLQTISLSFIYILTYLRIHTIATHWKSFYSHIFYLCVHISIYIDKELRER